MKFISIILIAFLPVIHINGQSNTSSNRYMEIYKQYLKAGCPLAPDNIRHFVYFSRDRELIHDHPFLSISRFAGAQIMYASRQLEPEEGHYRVPVGIAVKDGNYIGEAGNTRLVAERANLVPL